MKILYLIHQFMPEFNTGTEKFIYNLAAMSQKAGHNVKVITYSFYDKKQYDYRIGKIFFKDFLYHGIPVTALRHRNVPISEHYSLVDPELAAVAKAIIEKEKPDVVHVGHTMRMAEIVHQLKLLKVPYILTLTDYFLICPKVNLTAGHNNLCKGPQELASCRNLCTDLRPEYLKSRRTSAASILLAAEEITAPSNFIAGVFRSEISGLRISVVPHGLSFAHLHKNERAYTPESDLTFCFAGSLNAHKGVHLLIEAFQKLPHKNIKLKIFGSGPDNNYALSLKTKTKTDTRISFEGEFSPADIGEIMQGIDVIVIPSICYESFSFILHEAIACNVPVIASELGALPEKIKNNATGILFVPGSASSLSDALTGICNNRTLLNEYKAALRYLEVYKIEQEAHTYERIYKRALSSK